MQAALAITAELIDSEVAINELTSQIRAQIPDLSHASGLLFASPDYDWEELLPGLSENLGIDIIGATGESLLSSRGYQDEGAVLLVLSDANCSFACEVSGRLSSSEVTEANVHAMYDRALAKLGGQKPKLAFVFCPSNEDMNFRAETVLHYLRQQAGDGVPIFGGLASDMFTFTNTKVFGKLMAHDAAVAIMLVAGDINPLFVVRSVPRKRIAHAIATSVDGYLLKTIDNMPASNFLQKSGVDVDNPMALQFAPFCLEGPSGEIMVCRTARRCNHETGELEMYGVIPAGAAISLQQIDYQDIRRMAEEALREIRRQVESQDTAHKYSAILAISCCGRHLVLGPHKDMEGKLIGDIIASGFHCAGFYSLGEVCPLGKIANDNVAMQSRFHNLSLVLCAI